jgi:hypothetical protein
LTALEVVAERDALVLAVHHDDHLAVVADLAVHEAVADGRVRALLHLAGDAGLVSAAFFVVDAAVIAPGADFVIDVRF